MFIASTALAAGGNNGTVQINGDLITNGNDPHISCPITFKWAGFDAPPPNDSYTITMTGTSPTGGTVDMGGGSNQLSGSFSGPDNTLTTSPVISGGKPNHKGEYHISISVETKTATNTDTKSKTVWLSGCSPNAPSGGAISFSGSCTTAGSAASGYTWAITATAVPGAPAASFPANWNQVGGGGTGALTIVDGTTFTTPAGVNSITVTPNPALPAGWTLTQPNAATPNPCGTANKSISVSGTCNGANNGYSWQLSTTPATSGVAGTFAPHSAPANTTAFSTNGSGLATFTTGLADNSIDFVVSTGGWLPASGTVNATANCVNNPQPGQVSVDGHCNTTTQGYDWTVTTSPAAAGVDGTWAPSGGATTGWTTDATGHAAFSSGVGENHLNITITTGNWNGPASANATACVPPGQAAPVVTEANHCASGMNVTLSNMNGTAPATFTVVDPDGNVQTVTVNAGQLKKLVFAVKEDTTGTVSVTAVGGAKQQFIYKKNCATVLGVKHTRKPPHKPVVKGEHQQQLPFTGFDTKRALLDGSVVFFLGAVLCILGARRREEEPLYY